MIIVLTKHRVPAFACFAPFANDEKATVSKWNLGMPREPSFPVRILPRTSFPHIYGLGTPSSPLGVPTFPFASVSELYPDLVHRRLGDFASLWFVFSISWMMDAHLPHLSTPSRAKSPPGFLKQVVLRLLFWASDCIVARLSPIGVVPPRAYRNEPFASTGTGKI
ncbi:hypothetical protein BS47DRAFT_1395020 [Hydnum rufescens UP504]|uniref:Uncharacterized protein n=1 Tax=Hydnum rufescens UP504 TaxID=1448309 RepID=A0A9P6AT82_9AGAM|nr:hypothetical protein BS47DRAFT_1395020 [Hydnum rufescens UP504]